MLYRSHLNFFLKEIHVLLFIYLWLCWVFVSVRGLSPVAASGDHSSSWCAGLSPSRPLLLRSTGSRRAGSVIVAHGPSCSVACGILPDQGSNPCPLHWQADPQPLRHQGSPTVSFLFINTCVRSYFKCLTSVNPPNPMMRWYYHYSHFTDEGTEAQKLHRYKFSSQIIDKTQAVELRVCTLNHYAVVFYVKFLPPQQF